MTGAKDSTKFKLKAGVTKEQFLNAVEGQVVWEAGKKSLVMSKQTSPEHQARVAELTAIVDRILSLIKQGGHFSDDAKGAVTDLLRHYGSELSRTQEEHRKRLLWAFGVQEEMAVEPRRKGAAARLAKDPTARAKQQAKGETRKLWHERRLGKHPKLRTNEQFATEAMRRWPVLTSSKVICGWCTKWNKEVGRK